MGDFCRKPALPDELLLKVQKPARYLGNEMNAVRKDRNIPIRFVMCFPDLYEIGMSHLGIQILYELFNRRADTWCERVFSPWIDMDQLMREYHIPLFALESQDPVKDFDFLGITLQFELCYANILQILDLSGIPLVSSERREDDPIVIGGGPCACNPEPIARFFDLFYIGEGETSYDALLDLYRSMKERGEGRAAFLRAAAQIPGIYVPSLYEVEYGSDGTISSFRPKYADVPSLVRRQAAVDLDRTPYPVKPLIPFITVTQDRVAVELMRGCIRGCRFCQAGMIYRPNRERDLSTVQAYADSMLGSTGQDDILLSSLSSSDYSCIHEIVDYVSDRYEDERVKLQVPSLRIDAFSLDFMARVQDVRRSSLTFAPEAGSQRLRDVINKGITEEDILEGAREAFRGGWNKVKLYFMLGLPTETSGDRVAIAELANKISAAYYEEVPKPKRNGRCQITVSTSFFVPKPFTPLQWAPMFHAGDYLGFAAEVNHAIYASHNHKSVRYSWHDAEMIFLEGVLARGDRRTADLILEAYRLGAVFDCWLETWDYSRWEKAAENVGLDMDFYTLRERDQDEIFPWDFIDIGVRRDFLRREWEKARQAQLTPNCREACSGCGAASYGCGVCLRNPKAPGAGDENLPEARPSGKAEAEIIPAGQTLREQTPAEKMSAEKTSEEKISAEESTSEEDLISEKMSAEEAGSEEKAVSGINPAEQTLREQISAEITSAEKTSEEKISAEESTSEEDSISKKMSAEEAGSEKKSVSGKRPVEESTSEEDLTSEKTSERQSAAEERENSGDICIKIRMRLAKYGSMKFIGHLELMRFLQKCIRRTDIDIRYSDGITPRMIMSTAMPLGLGLTSSGEYVDIEIGSPISTEHALEQLRPLMPDGLEILDFRQIGETVPQGGGGNARKPQKAMSVVAAAEYKVRFRESFLPPENWREILLSFVGQEEIVWTKETKKGFRTLDMKPLIYSFSCEGEDIFMCVCSKVGENLRPEQIIGEAFSRNGYELPEDALQIHRTDLLAENEKKDSDRFISLNEMGRVIVI